ncbi:cation transporter, partial [Candidatus Gracilibacteria bacterium]|nr:cation transporter [Candidatus Gracilibacteria bacterium]
MMKHQKNKKITGFLPVLFAIIGNVIITCLKFIGFLISGSGALFSESIHGIADISNQILLMIGIKRSIKQPDDNFSYGYGHERFFWAVISACSIFFLGAGITLAKGFGSFYNNEVPHINIFIYLILIVSFIVESFTFYLAYRELINTNPNYALKDALKYGDPSTIAVLFEDGIAVIGIIIAFLSIALTN